MRVLKIIAEGITTSFRYPHFMQQVHPSFPAPPPATIYGHICSTLGEWFDPQGVQFAYHFQHQGTTRDKEHIILLQKASGKLYKGSDLPKILEGNVNPFEREIFFKPKLTLYLNRPDWENAFRCPRYAVALGRSQDLFTYTKVEVIDLEQAETAYFERTLLPYDMALQVQRGVAMLMPRYLDYEKNRQPVFDRYIYLNERVQLPNEDQHQFATDTRLFWVDPYSQEEKGAHLGLAFLNFQGG